LKLGVQIKENWLNPKLAGADAVRFTLKRAKDNGWNRLITESDALDII